MQTSELISRIEKTADPRLAASWDQSGMQVAGTKDEIQRLALTLDPTLECIHRALAWQADFILTHHPVTLTPELPKRRDRLHRLLCQLLGTGTALYAAHTSLDVQTSGPVSWLAQVLHLRQPRPVHSIHSQAPAQPEPRPLGYGIIGTLPQAMGWTEREKQLHHHLGSGGWIRTGAIPEHISCIAYCPGSGMDFAPEAFAQGADIFLSGDLKYHQAQDLEPLGLTLDVGHFVLEEAMMAQWARELDQEFQDLEVRFFPGHDPLILEADPSAQPG